MAQLAFNRDAFAQALSQYPHFQASNGWQSSGSSNTNSYTQLQPFTYDDPASGKKLDYCVWYPETSFLDNSLLTVSAKVDYRRTTGDDHMLVLCSFDGSGRMLSAQTTSQFHGSGNNSFTLKPIKNTDVSGGNLPLAVHDAMQQRQQGVDYGGATDNAGRHGLAAIAQAVLECMRSGVVPAS